MSLKDLEKELKKCDNVEYFKKGILQKLINKKLREQEKKEMEFKNKINDKVEKLLKIKKIKENESQLKKLKEFDKLISKRESAKQLQIDPKLKDPIELDYLNNKLMERLNSELDFRVRGGKTKEIMKPYDITECNGYWKEEEKNPINNFNSNKRKRSKLIRRWKHLKIRFTCI